MPQKQIFNQEQASSEQQILQPKQEFDEQQVQLSPDLDMEENLNPQLEQQLQQAISPRTSLLKKVLISTIGLFALAVLAQTIQWLWDSYQQQQWIYFAFALVSLFVVLLGAGAIGQEFRRLRKLKKRMQLQQASQQFQYNDKESAGHFSQDFSEQGQQQSQQLCLQAVQALGLTPQAIEVQQWQRQISPSHSAQEIRHLFSQQVLQPFDKQAKKLISQSAFEASMVVAISPLALVDMFFVAWRNLRLVNKIAQIYGIELGYFSRLRLLRLVLLNVAFAGVTELVQEIGMDWLSQDITAKVSARVAQGLGVGLITARLGIKAMEFCRPIAFQAQEKPRLGQIQKELLSHIKSQILGADKIKQKQTL